MAFLTRPDGSSFPYPFLTGRGDFSMNLFGQNDNSAPHNRYRWNGGWGHLWIDEAGLYLIGERWYHPDIGRFVTPGSPDYIYANNDPVNYTYAPVYDSLDESAIAGPESALASGSDPWPWGGLEWYIGIRVHQDIIRSFQMSHPGFTQQRTIAEILGDVPEDLWGRSFQPDLVNTIEGEVYEIKPHGNTSGPAQLQRYVEVLRAGDPLRREWHAGTKYTPPQVVYPVQLAGTPSVLRALPWLQAEATVVVHVYTQYPTPGKEGMIYYTREAVRYQGELYKTLAAAGAGYLGYRLVKAVFGCLGGFVFPLGQPAICAIAVASP